MLRAWTATLLLILATAVRAQGTPAEEGAAPLRLAIGERVAICETGTVICPALVTCDDPTIVSVGGDRRGPVLTGARIGTTLCAAASGSGMGMRRVYRVTVVPKPPPR